MPIPATAPRTRHDLPAPHPSDRVPTAFEPSPDPGHADESDRSRARSCWVRLGCRLIALAVVAAGALRAVSRRRTGDRRRLTGASGQATTEYALVLLAAALVALLVVGWATAGGGAARIGALFNRVIDAVIDRV